MWLGSRRYGSKCDFSKDGFLNVSSEDENWGDECKFQVGRST